MGVRLRGVALVILPVIMVVLNSNAIPLPAEEMELSLAQVDVSPVRSMVDFINSRIDDEEHVARQTIDKQVGVKSLSEHLDEDIDKVGALHGVANSADVGEGMSVEAMEKEEAKEAAKAAARAKVMAQMKKAKEAMHAATVTMSGDSTEALGEDAQTDSLDTMKLAIKKIEQDDMASVQKVQSPLDSAIDQIAVVRKKEKVKAEVKKELLLAKRNEDLAEARGGNTVLLQVDTETKPLAERAPGPPNPPIAEVKKEVPRSKPMSGGASAPADEVSLTAALAAAKPNSTISRAPLPDPALANDPDFSPDELKKEAEKVASYPITNDEVMKMAKAMRVPWNSKDKPKPEYENGPPRPKGSLFNATRSANATNSTNSTTEATDLTEFLDLFD